MLIELRALCGRLPVGEPQSAFYEASSNSPS